MKNKDIISLSLFSLLIFLGLIGMFLSFEDKKGYSPIPSNETTLIFDDLTTWQKDYSLYLVNNLNDDYVKFTKEIIFTNNFPDYCTYKECEEVCGRENQCGGMNEGNGIIYVNWFYNKEVVKDKLCHELLHNFIKTEKNDYSDFRHRIIDDAAKKGVCYG